MTKWSKYARIRPMGEKLSSKYGIYSKIVPEASYPANYREKNTQAICGLIKKQESVCVVGMKRVGISNFLRFLAFNPKVKEKYFGEEKGKFLFVVTDANDLIEVSSKAFWVMLLARLTEAAKEDTIDEKTRKTLARLYKEAQDQKDPFFIFDNLKKGVGLLTANTNLNLIFFLIHFDRLTALFDLQSFANLQALRDVAKHRVSYILTARRRLPELCPDCFAGASLNLFARSYFLKPASLADMNSISDYFERKIAQKIRGGVKDEIFKLCAGHTQFTQLALIAWSEWNKKDKEDAKNLLNHLLRDERIILQCEEIWERLFPIEQKFIKGLVAGRSLDPYEEKGVGFLFETGLITKTKKGLKLFSPLLEGFIKARFLDGGKKENKEFTKKENLLFSFLLENKDEICSRDEIIEKVWPDYAEIGVSDWAIDMLVARLRKKIKLREEPYKILTIRGRGHKLIDG